MGEQEELVNEEQPKKVRHRKKALYNAILKQMEFYFSDSNLVKDRFLAQLLQQDPNVDIEIFFKFNKIRKLNCSLEDLQKAVKKSELIALTEDGKKIYRIKPVKVKENIDYCTIYVENIKPDASHESLSQIFSDFGNVTYVSIPKYRHNKQNKGFAFIEFENEEQANMALTYFENIGCRIPTEKNPEELQSIVTFDGDQPVGQCPAEEKGTKRTFSESEPIENANSSENSSAEKKNKKKIKTEDIQENILTKEEEGVKEETDEIKKKRKHSIENANSSAEKKDKRLKTEEVPGSLLPKEEEGGKEETDETKKKKKHKKDKKKSLIKEMGMQVLAKKDWKKLRNKYLQLQRHKMKEFKQYLHKQRFGTKPYDENADNTQENIDVKETEGQNIEEKLAFNPGVVVKLTLSEPCDDVKKLKNEIKLISPEVKYVDIPLPCGNQEIHIRFATASAAKTFKNNAEFHGDKTVLSGEEEHQYWEKLQVDRAAKFQKNIKKQRGRDRLLKKAEELSAKHVKFDENE